MSKGTNVALRCCGWQWARMRAAPARRATVKRTALRATSAFLILLAGACSRSAPEQEYQAVRQAYLRGELEPAAASSARLAKKYQSKPVWHWQFRLLQAESLLGIPKEKEAAALLAEKTPNQSGMDQLEARRLIDLAGLRKNTTEEANEFLAAARQIVRDPELEIRLHLAQGQVWIRAQDLGGQDREFQAAL